MTRLRHHFLHLALASGLLSIGAVSLGWLPPLFDTTINPILDYLRNTSNGRFIARLSLITGSGLLLQNWLSFGRLIFTRTQTSLKNLLPSLLIPAVALFLTPPLFSRDVYSYMAQARLFLRGLSPYEYGVGWLPGWFQLGADPLWVDTPTPYGPLAIWMSAGIEAITDNSPYNALLWHRLVALVGIGLGVYASHQILRERPQFSAAAIWLAWLNPLVVLHFISAAHNDSLMLGLLLLGFTFAQKNRFAMAIGFLILAAGIKPIALLAAPFIIMGSTTRNVLQLLKPWLIGAAFVLSGLWIQGAVTGLGLGWVNSLSAPTAVRSLLSPVTASAEILTRPFEALGWIDADLVIGFAQTLAIVSALGVLLFLVLTPSVRTPLRATAIAFTAVVALSPVVQPWYLLWAFSFIAVAGINKSWHLKAVVLLTAIFVSYSAIEANIVLDTAIDMGDFVTGLSAMIAVGLVIWFSSEERNLLLGNQFDSGLVAEYFEIKTDPATVQSQP